MIIPQGDVKTTDQGHGVNESATQLASVSPIFVRVE